MIADSNGDRSGDTRPLWITGLSPPDSWRSLRQPGYLQLDQVRHPKHRVWGYDRTLKVRNFQSTKVGNFQSQLTDRLIGMVRRAWSDHQSFRHVTGTSICLSCLLEAGRYDELQELLATRRTKFWSWHRFGAEALVRQGLWEAAIAFAEGVRDTSNSRHDDNSIDCFVRDF